MMPGNSVEACQETPYLKQDPGVKGLATADLLEAKASMARMQEKAKAAIDLADVSLAAYATMYQAAKALLHYAGYAFENFRCLISALNSVYVKSGKLDKALVEQLIAAQKLVGESQDHTKAAEVFVARTKELIR